MKNLIITEHLYITLSTSDEKQRPQKAEVTRSPFQSMPHVHSKHEIKKVKYISNQ